MLSCSTEVTFGAAGTGCVTFAAELSWGASADGREASVGSGAGATPRVASVVVVGRDGKGRLVARGTVRRLVHFADEAHGAADAQF